MIKNIGLILLLFLLQLPTRLEARIDSSRVSEIKLLNRVKSNKPYYIDSQLGFMYCGNCAVNGLSFSLGAGYPINKMHGIGLHYLGLLTFTAKNQYRMGGIAFHYRLSYKQLRVKLAIGKILQGFYDTDSPFAIDYTKNTGYFIQSNIDYIFNSGISLGFQFGRAQQMTFYFFYDDGSLVEMAIANRAFPSFVLNIGYTFPKEKKSMR